MCRQKSFSILLLCAAIYSAFAEEAAAPIETSDDAPALPNIPVAAVNGGNSFSVLTTTPAPVEKETPEYLKNCFYTEAKLCHDLYSTENETNSISGAHKIDGNICQCRPHPSVPNSWYCCNITQMTMISSCSNINSWVNLHIINASMNELDLKNSIYQTLHSLAITDGNVTKLTGIFSRMSSIKCLNISNNNLSFISPRALSSIPNLKFLDISNNNLTRLPKMNQNQNITVDMRRNKGMLCFDLMETIFRDSIKIVKPESTYCGWNQTFSWFNATDDISIKELEILNRYEAECPVIKGYGNCTCTREQMVIMGDQSKLFCRVDCSNLGLVELPPKLPANTFILNISNNSITSIGKHFHSNPTYWNIVKLYADNNKISSIYELEGTKFMDQFQRLSLRNNALTKLPVYLFTNDLVDTEVGRSIFLAGNKLQCDCNSAKFLKRWLLERSRDIPDYADIQCRNIDERVMEIQEMKLCQSPHDWIDYIYYLIATEVILLLALITKVSYDYWVFKTAGYLPWPASKMPKLPCDWLCES